MGDVITVDLGEGAFVHAEVTVLDRTETGPAPTSAGRGGDAGVRDAAARAFAELPQRLDAVREVVRGVGRWAADGIAGTGPAVPDTLEVEFGLKLAVKSGALVGVLAEAGGEASFTVRMSWDTARVAAARAARDASPDGER
ncbi:CU044_2847 family protein [Kitasatospora sp. NPDC101176]|uniref:CU044_2847 family protein n=1 Tax=Kitasatospora sp. NPDC101176 TaxID=3364099 RepID=UPI0037F4ADFE